MDAVCPFFKTISRGNIKMAKVINVVKPLIIENKETGKTLTVEFNRAVIKKMDRLGLIGGNFAEQFNKSPLSTAGMLFFWGLQMHHPEITEEESDAILFDEIGLTEEVMTRLGELFMTPYTSIMDARKNSVWTVK
nr:MAG TPA: protein of unknown function (DUF5055) [Bacteriophage sp.]